MTRCAREVPVTDRLRQPLGLVHGGVYATIADALTARRRPRDLQPDELPAPDHGGHDPRRRAPPPPGPHDRGVGGRPHRRRRSAVRARADDDLPGPLTQAGLGELAQPAGRRRRDATSRRRHASAVHAVRRPGARREDHGLPGGGELGVERARDVGCTASSAPAAVAVVGDHDVAELQRLEQLVVGELGLRRASIGSARCGAAGRRLRRAARRASAARRRRGACAPRSGSSAPGPAVPPTWLESREARTEISATQAARGDEHRRSRAHQERLHARTGCAPRGASRPARRPPPPASSPIAASRSAASASRSASAS